MVHLDPMGYASASADAGDHLRLGKNLLLHLGMADGRGVLPWEGATTFPKS